MSAAEHEATVGSVIATESFWKLVSGVASAEKTAAGNQRIVEIQKGYVKFMSVCVCSFACACVRVCASARVCECECPYV